MEDLTLIQKEIVFELEYLKEKSMITEKFLAKKVREHAKIQGKSKAGICLNDLEICLGYLSEQKQLNFSIHLNSANDIFIKKDDKSATSSFLSLKGGSSILITLSL